MDIRIGDMVQIRRDCTIEELMENKWNKAHKDTLEFLKTAELDETYEVADISNKGNVVIEAVGNDNSKLFVNYNLFEVVERADDEDDDYEDEDEATEMTIEEIQEELGYKIKIVG